MTYKLLVKFWLKKGRGLNIIDKGPIKLNKKTLEIIEKFSAHAKPKQFPIVYEFSEITDITPKTTDLKRKVALLQIELRDANMEREILKKQSVSSP